MKPKHLVSRAVFVTLLFLLVNLFSSSLVANATASTSPVFREKNNTPKTSSVSSKSEDSPEPVGTLNEATWCADPYIDDLSLIYPPYYGSYPIYDTSGLQLYTLNPCAGRPYIINPDYIEMASADTINVYCNNVLAFSFTGPGTYTANSTTAGICGGQNWWGGLIGISVAQKPPPPELNASMESSTAISFSWTESDPSVKYYVLYTALGATGYVQANDLTGTSYTLTITNPLPPGQTYGPFYLVAFNDDSTYSDRSNEVSPVATGKPILKLDSALPLRGAATFEVDPGVPDSSVNWIDLLINGNKVGIDSAAPWNFSFNTATIPNGTYDAVAVVYYKTNGISDNDSSIPNGSSASDAVSVSINNPNPGLGIAASKINPPNSSNTLAAAGGSIITLTGSFPTTNAAVQFVRNSSVAIDEQKHVLAKLLNWLLPTAYAQDFITIANGIYEIDSVQSNGTTLTFTIPAGLPSGNYSVRAGTPNNFWSNTLALKVSDGSSNNSGPSSPTTATPTYSCASGYTLTSTNKCYRPANIQQYQGTQAANASYSCPSGYTRAGAYCTITAATYAQSLPVTVTYSCPSGMTLSGSSCIIPAGYVWSKESTLGPIVTYTCQTAGYVLDSPSAKTCHSNTAPTDLSAASAAGSINLSWTANSARQTSSFAIERAPNNSSKFAQIGTTAPYSLGGTAQYGNYSDATVSTGKTYIYRVRAQFSDGTYSDYSNTVQATVVKAVTSTAKISAPNVSVTGPFTASSLNISWVPIGPGDNITKYLLTDPANHVSYFTPINHSTTIYNLLPKTKYCYTVRVSYSSDDSILSPAGQACGTTQAPSLTLSAPSSMQLSKATTLSVINSNHVARITSVDLYVGKSSTPFATSKSISSIPFDSTSLATGKYKAYALVHFDSGATFKTKSITLQITNNAPNQSSLNKNIAADGNSPDSDATYTAPDGATEDISAETGDTGSNSANSPVQIGSPSQQTPSPAPSPVTPPTPPTAPAAPSTPPQLSTISGPATLNVGDTGKWSFSAIDPQGNALTYSIDWGDSTGASTSAVPSFKHSYAMSGVYTITASAKDSSGLTGQTTLSVVVASPVSAPPAPVSSVAPSASVTASVVDADSDKVGVWNVFGPGTGRVNGNNPYDWHFNAVISNASGKTIAYATVIMNGVREGWSTSASTNNAFGVQLYPLVMSALGFTNTAADQTYMVPSNSLSVDLYTQPEDPVGTTFKGATLTIGFTDGTSITAQIPAASIAIPAAPAAYIQEHSQTASATEGLSGWLHAITLW